MSPTDPLDLQTSTSSRGGLDWDQWWSDDALSAVVAANGYRAEGLPRTALQFLDRLRELGYRIGEREDLHLQDATRQALVDDVLDGGGDQSGAVAEGGCADGALSGQGSRDVGHEGVLSVSGLDAPTSPEPPVGRAWSTVEVTVEDGPDTALVAASVAAGPARAEESPSRAGITRRVRA